MKMVYFNGSLKLKVCEAAQLKPTKFATRHQMGQNKTLATIDPYISVDIDECFIARTTSKTKTCMPIWNEDIVSEVHNGQIVGLTVFHDAAIPPDIFVANCRIPFEHVTDKKTDIWVSREICIC